MRQKILVVDDEPEICETISSYFRKRSYDVVTATNGQEAINKLLSEKPSLILLDILMPQMDGIECLRIIKKLDKEVIVIIMTVVTDLDIGRQALELGAKDYITKPVVFEALETSVSTYLLLDTVK